MLMQVLDIVVATGTAGMDLAAVSILEQPSNSDIRKPIANNNLDIIAGLHQQQLHITQNHLLIHRQNHLLIHRQNSNLQLQPIDRKQLPLFNHNHLVIPTIHPQNDSKTFQNHF
jgi:hypothetical protein